MSEEQEPLDFAEKVQNDIMQPDEVELAGEPPH